ncbi:MAG: hypothetical protein Q9208_008021 [Pyrenodesmia sp. 3 TL-2023]
MAEIAAVGLAAAIIQLGAFATKVVDRCKEFRLRSKDVPKAFRTISVQLPLIVSSLEQIRDQTGEASLTPLKPVIEACYEEVKYLEGILDEILSAPGASTRERYTLALRSVRHDSEVKKSIANLQSNMDLLLVSIGIRASHVLQQLQSDGELREVISLMCQVAWLTAQPSLLKDLRDKLEATQSPSDSSIAADPGDENALVPQESSLQQRPTSKAWNPLEFHAVLIDELVGRRKELLTTSQRVLPRRIFEELAGSSGALPDIEAISLIKALRDAGDNVDRNFWCYTPLSVYDLNYITAEAAELLFDAGFTNLEGKDEHGFTLLLRTAIRTQIMGTISYDNLQPPIDAEEAQELQEEDKSRMQRFYELLPTAKLEYQQLSKSFSEFWPTFYQDHIASSPNNEGVNIEYQSMVELGVQIHEIDEGIRELNMDESRKSQASSDSD